jgi:hypothetical protein
MTKEKEIQKLDRLTEKFKKLKEQYKSEYDNLNDFLGLIQHSMSIESQIELFENRNGMKIVILRDEFKPGKDFEFDGDYQLIYQ